RFSHPRAGAGAVRGGLRPLGGGLQPLGSAANTPAPPADKGPATQFYIWFGIIAALCAAWMAPSYLRMTGDRFELIKLLTTSVMPLGILTVLVLAVILFGITTATESA